MLSQLMQDLEPFSLFAALQPATRSLASNACTFFHLTKALCILVLDVALPFCTAGDPILPLYLCISPWSPWRSEAQRSIAIDPGGRTMGGV